MEDLSLPAELVEFLREGRERHYDSAVASAAGEPWRAVWSGALAARVAGAVDLE